MLTALLSLFVSVDASAGDDLIAFTNKDARVCIASDAGKDTKCVTTKKGTDTDVTASRDGKWIAYAHASQGGECGYEIRVVRPDGSGMRELTCFDGNDRAPAFSRDGKDIYFERQSDVLDIWRVGLDGDNLEQVTDTPLINEGEPVPSPRENQIAFTVFEPTQLQVWLAKRDGSDATQLTFGPDDHFEPAYAPSGERIAFTKRPDGFSGDTDLEFIGSGPIQPLASTAKEESNASYSADGKRIAYSVGGAIWTMRANGSVKRRILAGSNPAFVAR